VWRVLPDVRAIDRVFDYQPVGHDPVPVGTIVRVPLHGRRVRGWLVAVGDDTNAPDRQLLAVHAIVSAGPPPDVVELCRWAAWRWAGPWATFLRAASPPNVVDPRHAPPEPDLAVHPPSDAPLSLPDGDGPGLVVWPPARDRTALVRSLLAPEGSTIVVVPDRDEQEHLAARRLDRDPRRHDASVVHDHELVPELVGEIGELSVPDVPGGPVVNEQP
jgi:primosomal protein N' (replication factor Y)